MTMNTMTTIESLQENDRAQVHDLLARAGLPRLGFDAPHVVAVVAKRGAEVVGSAAIETYGRFGVLRSVAVAESCRGQALGADLTRATIARARAEGLTALYLLTETAAGFFPRFGFVPTPRTSIPNEVQQSVEFTTACPSTAQALELSL